MAELVGLEARLVYDSFHRPLFDTTTTLDDGSIIRKKLSFENFKKALGIASKRQKLVYSPIPALPKFFYKGGVTTKADSFWVALFVPAGLHQYCISQTNEFMQLPYPSLLFVLEVQGGRAKSRLCYAVKDDVLTDGSILCQYPYGHVSRSGDICMGSCSAIMQNITQADAFVDAFLSGKDAGHYYTQGAYAKPKVPLRKLVGMVKERGEFPKEWLLPLKDNKNHTRTVGSLLDHYISSLTYVEED